MYCVACGTRRIIGYRFCEHCGNQFVERRAVSPNDTEQGLITTYYKSGYSHKTIIQFMTEKHNINLSLTTLKRRIRSYGLSRLQNVDDNTLSGIVQNEVNGSSSNFGYRSMWGLLKSKYGIDCTRDKVMTTLRCLDPDGTKQRKSRVLKRRRYKSKGPNDTWHMDGYDKLKPYGLPIHGAIDGFSRKIIWLAVCKSNNNPSIPAYLYLEAIKKEIIPRLLRTDAGTENGTTAAIHCALHENINAHKYGSSVSNQRIENWWSSLRRTYTGWVIDFFKRKIDNGSFVTGSWLFQETSWFAFSPLLQKELFNVVKNWNCHRIRKSGFDTIGGIPNQLYDLPTSFGFEEQGTRVTEEDLNKIDGIKDIENNFCSLNSCDIDLKGYFEHVIATKDIPYPPSNWVAAEQLFDLLISLCT